MRNELDILKAQEKTLREQAGTPGISFEKYLQVMRELEVNLSKQQTLLKDRPQRTVVTVLSDGE